MQHAVTRSGPARRASAVRRPSSHLNRLPVSHPIGAVRSIQAVGPWPQFNKIRLETIVVSEPSFRSLD